MYVRAVSMYVRAVSMYVRAVSMYANLMTDMPDGGIPASVPSLHCFRA